MFFLNQIIGHSIKAVFYSNSSRLNNSSGQHIVLSCINKSNLDMDDSRYNPHPITHKIIKYKQHLNSKNSKAKTMQSSQTLQEKQAYLRTHIDEELYQKFYDYCLEIYKSVDINAWSMAQVMEIAAKFNYQFRQDKKPRTGYSYNDYQSRPGDHKGEANEEEPSEFSQCHSSRIVKSSAVQLLDEVLQSQNQKISQKPINATSRNSTNLDNRLPTKQFNKTSNSSAVSFQQFDFWTSTINTPSNSSKISSQIRNKSTSQIRGSKNIVLSSPQTPKNVYNLGDYNYLNNFSNTNASQGVNNSSNININAVEPKRSRFQTQQLKVNDFDIFAAQDGNKKSSPYMKKQAPQQVYEGSKPSIKLKEVRELEGAPQRGLSVNIDRSRTSVVEPPFEDSITCFKSAVRHQLSDRSLNVFIDKHEIIQRKFLAADYAMYNVKVVPLGIQCKRNYQDFSKLRSNLAKFFPGIHLPYLEQTSWLSGTNVDFINNQKKFLQFFTRDLIRNKQFRNSRLMEDFLTLKDHKTIKRKYQKYEQMQPLKGLQQLCLLQGKVKVMMSNQQQSYIQNFEKFLEKMNELYERQEKYTQTLIDQYNDLMRTFKSLITLMEEMEKLIKQFNTKALSNTIKYLGNSFRIVRETYKQQFSNIKFDYEINTKKILPFLKYERKNFLELNKLIQIEKKLKKSFDKRSLTEKIGVGQNYLSESVKGTKKSILTESDSLIVLKYQVGYFGYQTRHESQRVFDQLAIKTVGRWQSLGQSYLDKLSNSISYWQGITKMDRDKFNTELTF